MLSTHPMATVHSPRPRLRWMSISRYLLEKLRRLRA